MNPGEEGGEFPDHDVPATGSDAFDELVASARQSDAALRRRRRRWREQRRAEGRGIEEVLLGTLHRRVVVHLVGGTRLAGTVEALGIDVAQLTADGRRSWLALDAAVAVEHASAPQADPADRDATTMADVLEDLLVERAEVRITLRSGADVAGTLIAVGESVELRRHGRTSITVRTDEVALLTR